MNIFHLCVFIYLVSLVINVFVVREINFRLRYFTLTACLLMVEIGPLLVLCIGARAFFKKFKVIPRLRKFFFVPMHTGARRFFIGDV